jgi:hypothetical protein
MLTACVVWEAAAEADKKRREEERQQRLAERSAIADEMKKQRMEMEDSISDPAQRAAQDPPTQPKRKGVST